VARHLQRRGVLAVNRQRQLSSYHDRNCPAFSSTIDVSTNRGFTDPLQEDMPILRVIRIAVLAALVAGVSLPVYAASSARIQAIDTNSVAAIPGNVSPRLAAAKDLGLASTGQIIQRMSLRFSMTASQQAALTQLLENLQNPASPQYHQWLTPEQFGAQFGLAQSDLAQVSQWLTAQGFTVTSVGRGSEFIEFSGTVGQANQAFHTQLHSVQLGTETHLANYTAPILPKAIANVTAAVTGLTDFKMKPHVKTRVMPGSATPATGLQPNYITTVLGRSYNFVAPGDFYTIYDETPALTSSINGTGVKIAVVGQTDVYSTDIATFRSVSGRAIPRSWTTSLNQNLTWNGQVRQRLRRASSL